MAGPLVIYGAYGYTGELVARRAVERGLSPVLAGRDSERLARLARALGCEWRAFPLSEPEALRRGLAGAAVVVHCAGPFARTAQPMAEACVDERVHYVDLTGEIPVFQALAALGPAARNAGIMLLPGAGFEVVPTDCLAAHLVRRLPAARALALVLEGFGRLSRGTARTVAEGAAALPRGRVLARRTFDLGRGPVEAVSVPWADTFTAPRSTAVEDVTTWLVVGSGVRALGLRAALRVAPFLAPLLEAAPLRDAAVALATGGERGPTDSDRAARGFTLRGEATDAGGHTIASLLRGPNAYALTALASVEITERALRGEAKPGWQTPSTAFGPDLVLALPGVTREDL